MIRAQGEGGTQEGLWKGLCLSHVWKEAGVNCSVMSNSLQPHFCSLPGSSIHGILQARTLEWVAISFSREGS